LPSEVAGRADASDMVQQTFAVANASFAAFRGNSLPELFKWLTVILSHNVSDTVRLHRILAIFQFRSCGRIYCSTIREALVEWR
jgi:hypothetical protein